MYIKDLSRHISVVCALLIFSLASHAQIIVLGGSDGSSKPKQYAKEIKLMGVVRDRVTNAQLFGAEVRMYDAIDTLLNTAKADTYEWDNGRQKVVQKASFTVVVPKEKTHYRMIVIHEGYDTLEHYVDLTDLGSRETVRKLGNIYLDQHVEKRLKEVTVQTSKIKFYNKGDTLIFNADAFDLPEGSMLDDLVKQMPGVEIRDGGQIYVNGKYVDALLLNGKDFFNDDKELMLQNLSAYTVQSVEAYDKYSDEDKFLGIKNEKDKQYVMDVKLKKEYIGGWNVSMQGGYGTEDRYLGRVFAMHYNALQQYTFFANINNLNDSRRPTDQSQWDPDTRPQGSRQYKQGGFDYSVESADGKQKHTGSVIATYDRNLNITESNTTNLLPSGNTFQNSVRSSLARNFNINTSHELSWETERVRLALMPKLQYGRSRSNTTSRSVSFRKEVEPAWAKEFADRWQTGGITGQEREDMINAVFNEAYSSSNNTRYELASKLTYKVPKTNDFITVRLVGAHSNSPGRSRSTYLVDYGDPDLSPLARRQSKSERPVHSTSVDAGVGYNLTLTSKLRFNLDYMYTYYINHNTLDFYMGQLQSGYTGDYTLENLMKVQETFDPANSYALVEPHQYHTLTAGVTWDFAPNWTFVFHGGEQFNRHWARYKQDGEDYYAKYTKPTQSVNSYLMYNKNEGRKNTSFFLMYYYTFDLPGLSKMITLPNTTDPLNVYLGNPDLRASKRQTLSGDISKSFGNGLSLYMYASGNYSNASFANGYVYDTNTGVRYYKTYNVDGAYDLRLQPGATYQYKILNFNVSLRYNRNRSYNMIGDYGQEPIKAGIVSQNYGGNIGVRAQFSQKFWMRLSYNTDWQRTKNKTLKASNFNINEGTYSLSANLKLPYAWEISTNSQLYARNGYSDPEMNDNSVIINGRISKGLMKGKLVLSVDVYDLLHQMKNVSYSVTPDARIETFTNTLPRYVLFHAQYRFQVQPKKKIDTGKSFSF